MKTLYDVIKECAGGEDPVGGGTYSLDEIAAALAMMRELGHTHLFYLDTQIRGEWTSSEGFARPRRTVTVTPIIVKLPLEFLTPEHFSSGDGTLFASVASTGHDGVRHAHAERVLLDEADARAVAATTEYQISTGLHMHASVWPRDAGQVQLTEAERVVFHAPSGRPMQASSATQLEQLEQPE